MIMDAMYELKIGCYFEFVQLVNYLYSESLWLRANTDESNLCLKIRAFIHTIYMCNSNLSLSRTSPWHASCLRQISQDMVRTTGCLLNC